MRIRNLTPHEVVVITELGDELRLDPEARSARIRTLADRSRLVSVATGAKIRVMREAPVRVVDLPEPSEDVLLVVSRLVAERARRADVVCPTDIVRDDSGRVVGCRALAHFARPHGQDPSAS